MNFYGKFEIDIVKALSNQLIDAFNKLSIGKLDKTDIQKIPTDQGVYQLFKNNELVYVGKTKNLTKRLTEHHQKILGRKNISISEMGFKCLIIHKNWTALAPEQNLIKYYKQKKSGACEWNGNSFGPHDPGRERETTNKAPSGFDVKYPIKNEWICDTIKKGKWNGNDLLMEIKKELPYTFRYQTTNQKRWRDGHNDYKNMSIDVPSDNMSIQELLILVNIYLNDWQVTIFPSHIILYKESEKYKHGKVLV